LTVVQKKSDVLGHLDDIIVLIKIEVAGNSVSGL
jgi:hypothetical protein